MESVKPITVLLLHTPALEYNVQIDTFLLFLNQENSKKKNTEALLVHMPHLGNLRDVAFFGSLNPSLSDD